MSLRMNMFALYRATSTELEFDELRWTDDEC